MPEQEPEDRKRKAAEEVQHDEKRASKAAAVDDGASEDENMQDPKDEASEDENMQDLNAASVNTRGMILKGHGTSAKGQTETK